MNTSRNNCAMLPSCPLTRTSAQRSVFQRSKRRFPACVSCTAPHTNLNIAGHKAPDIRMERLKLQRQQIAAQRRGPMRTCALLI
eukprot:183807-Alexandrium_andersonii.AAC.1